MPEIGTANGSITAGPANANSAAWAHCIFAGAAAGSGLFFYGEWLIVINSESLQPALQTAGLDGMWL